MIRIRRRTRKEREKAAKAIRLYCSACGWVTEHLYERDDANESDIYRCRVCRTEQIYYDSKRKKDYDKLGYDGLGGI